MSYDALTALHVIAVLAAFGLPLSYPVVLPWARRTHPEAMAAVHHLQQRMAQLLIAPGTVALLAFGLWMAADRDLFGELWVQLGLASVAVIAVVGGGYIGPVSGRLSVLAADGRTAEYDALFRRMLLAESALGGLVLATVVVMVVKPG